VKKGREVGECGNVKESFQRV